MRGSEIVFHPFDDAIVQLPLLARISNRHYVHDLPATGKHHFLIINIVVSITAEDKPRSSTWTISYVLVASRFCHKPALELFGRLPFAIVPATHQELRCGVARCEIMKARLSIASG